MALQLYNTLSRSKEPFQPLDPPKVGMYVCGPTVYGHPHLGHAKSYISFDVILRYLRYRGYQVNYIQNITDVGHLSDDTEGMADQGEDKVIAEARRRGLHPMAVAERYTHSYYQDMGALNVLRPDIAPRASGHIPEQIAMAGALIEKGLAYEVNGNVYFDVARFKSYGKLSRRRVEEMEAGARVEINSEKKHAADFALWKRADRNHAMRWPSPWGEGYPGWHLECSAMSTKYLGPSFDIHGGGIENQFPHHECEIAQSEGAYGKPFVKYWLHHNMVTMDGQKMGKSLGNFITLKQLFSGEHERLTRPYPAMVVRHFVLGSHYRSPQDFSDAALGAAASGYEKLSATVAALAATSGDDRDEQGKIDEIQAFKDRFIETMDDDFNTAAALATLFELARFANSAMQNASQKTLDALQSTFQTLGGEVLGLRFDVSAEADHEKLESLMSLLIVLRDHARRARDFKTADLLRDRLIGLGVQLEDGPQGTHWSWK